jgi:hypothetical protein
MVPRAYVVLSIRDAKGMATHHERTARELYDVFASRPSATRWKPPAGTWIEW